MQALGIQLPKLPELDKDDLKAVRSFLPGKLLSRTAALLAHWAQLTGDRRDNSSFRRSRACLTLLFATPPLT